MPTIYATLFDGYKDMLEAAGLTLADSPDKADHACCTSEFAIREFAAKCAPYGNFRVNVDVIDKRVLASTFASIGVQPIPHIALTGRDSIESVPWPAFFCKPAWAASSFSPSSFDYVTYRSKADAYAAFDADASNSVDIRNAIIQPSYSINGKTTLMICSASVNGSGVVSMEPVIMAQQRERYGGGWYGAVRGGSDDHPHAATTVDAMRRFIAACGIRNTHMSIQFIDTGTGFLPMDIAYRMEYLSMYVMPKLGPDVTYHLDRIRFAYDMLPTPPTFSDVTSFRYIVIRDDVDAAQVKAAMDRHNIKFLNAFNKERFRMFGNSGPTKAEVVAAMDAFESEVGNA